MSECAYQQYTHYQMVRRIKRLKQTPAPKLIQLQSRKIDCTEKCQRINILEVLGWHYKSNAFPTVKELKNHSFLMA